MQERSTHPEAHPRTEHTGDKPVVVGIGASAGGLDALSKLLSAVPEESGMSFVVIQHLDPTHESALTELLARQTSMVVEEVDGDTRVEPNRVYVIPPNKYLAIEDCVLKLSDPKETRGMRMAVDYFFRSLAEDCCEYSIGIVLSGTGSDGTSGLREIKNLGGLTIAQDPKEAGQDGMPRSAIDSGHVDLVLPVGEMPETLVKYVQHSYLHGPLTAQALQESQRDHLTPILQVLRKSTDFDFRRYRKNTLLRRIHRRMGLKHIEDLGEYLHVLRDSRAEITALARDLLIGVTGFFRDPDAWETLEDNVLAPLVEDCDQQQPIRAWTPGCATGEEAYTLAILLDEQIRRAGKPCRFQIFATDIAEDSLETGRAGLYPETIAQDITKERLKTYFTKQGNTYRVTKSLRESVVFASQNVLAQPPFSKLDLIICRNLLIYLEPDAQRRLLSVFQFALREGRYLFLGSSESVGERTDLFTAISPKWRIYVRTPQQAPPMVDFPEGPLAGAKIAQVPEQRQRRKSPDLAARVHQQLLSESEEAIAVVNAENQLVLLQGPFDRYLQMPAGELSPKLPDIVDVCRNGLRVKVRSLLHRIRKGSEPAQIDARVKRDGRYEHCRISMRYLGGSPEDRTVLVTFAPQPVLQHDGTPEGSSVAVDEVGARELEQELATTREELNSTVEELETANEELKASNEEAMATNEELQSTNEELETSKEELQSLNEELTTLNSQLEMKVDQLQRTTNDLTNLFSSTQIGTLFLDSQFRIRRFTPACRDLFHLIESDVGRPLEHVTRRFTDDALVSDAEAVLDDLQPREAQVKSESGRAYVRRILPYRSDDDRIEGVVITFADVTRLEALTDRLRRRERQQAALAQLGQQALTDPDSQALMDRIVELVADALRVEFAKVLELLPDGERLLLRASHGFREGLVGKLTLGVGTESQAGYTLRSSAPVIVEDLGTEKRFSGPKLLRDHGVVSGMSVIIQGTAGPWGVLGAHSNRKIAFSDDDVHFLQAIANLLGETLERQRVNEALEDSEERFRALADNVPQLAWIADPNGSIYWYNRRWFEFTGTTLGEMEGWGWQAVHHPEHLPRVVEKWRTHLAAGEAWEDTFPLRRADGQYRWFLSRAMPIRNADGSVRRWFGTNTDITERMVMEEALREADQRKDEFLATLAHELRNPLAPIRSSLDLLRMGDGDDAPQLYEIMERQTHQLIRLVDELMDVSRISRGKVSLRKQRLDLHEVVQGAVEATAELFDQRGHQFDVHLPVTPVQLDADPVRLTQILSNLLSNAARYTPAGGHVELEAKTTENTLEIRVRDNGIGMPPEMLRRVFDLFVQGEKRLDKSQSGLGIGLTLTRSLVELHGGTIGVHSEGVGQGSEFVVTLPLVSETGPAEATRQNTPHEPSAPHRRILVVDDNRDAASMLARLLSNKGHETHVVYSGREALEAGPKFQPHIVLLDLGMPDTNGLDTARELRQREWGKHVRLIAVTGWGQESDRRQTAEAGFDEHLVKPVNITTLEALFTDDEAE
ncbi:MAG: response regulator [Planctomycetota bacterium]|nr:MAG: response regulator [Planctomycetota bacterium]